MVKSSPMRLAVWAIAGALLAASTFFLTFLPVPRLAVNGPGFWSMLWAGRLLLLVWLMPLLMGAAIWWRAQSLFRRGFVDEVWSEVELRPVRELVARRVWSWGTLCGGLLALLLMAFTTRRFHHENFIVVLTFPLNAVGSLKQLLTPPGEARGGFLDLRGSKPLRSEHWGEARNGE